MQNALQTFIEIDKLVNRYPALEICRDSIIQAVEIIRDSFKSGGKLITCGNGGSASDAQHIVGELMKSFAIRRKVDPKILERIEDPFVKENLEGTLPAISLVNETALITAFANDRTADLIFAQQILGIGNSNDVLLAISTSGNSKNVIHVVEVARAKNLKTIALTGRSGGKLRDRVDVAIRVPSDITFEIQEFHLPIYHAICLELEREFFSE
ncbi:MAG: SIS domain-containing protein [Selenomonadaceae bacterium]|nr:SIS domain-containing protein [Selenomonadaceae bacterium]